MWRSTTASLFGLLAFGSLAALAADELSLDVDLGKADAAADWVLPPRGGASLADGHLLIDGLAHRGPEVFLREPILRDFTLTCKILVDPTGDGVRAFGVNFRSTGIASYQWLHVNRSNAIVGWSDRQQHWHEVQRVAVQRHEGTWLDVLLQCEGPQIRFYLDEKLVASTTDSHYQAGRIGFAASQGLVRVKDVHLAGTPATLDEPWRSDPPPRFPAHGTYHELDPKRRHTDVSGKLEITVGKPFVISSRVTRPELGAHEQPHLFKMPCGDVHLVFHKDGDVHGATRVILRSSDNGKTWEPMPIQLNRHEAVGVLRDGTTLAYDDYAFRKEDNLFVGQMCISPDGGRSFGPVELAIFHRPAGASARAASTYWNPKDLDKYRATSAKWSDDLCHALWRSVLQKEDGTLIASAHTRYKGDKKARTVCYHSTDGGKTWGDESTVAYDAEIAGEGFVEPVMAISSGGDVLCVMRTGGHLPLMQARSADGGKTWQKPTRTGSLGVDPDLCLMTGGLLACSYGRPGNRIMFSVDGTGRQWTDRVQIYEYDHGSFGYTGIVEVEPARLLYVYDRHDAYPQYDGKRTTAIQGVYVTVRKKG